jgi:hypothetical protein
VSEAESGSGLFDELIASGHDSIEGLISGDNNEEDFQRHTATLQFAGWAQEPLPDLTLSDECS